MAVDVTLILKELLGANRGPNPTDPETRQSPDYEAAASLEGNVLDVALTFKSPKAQALRDDYRNGVHELIAPAFFPYEVGNALTNAEQQKVIKPPDGWTAWLTVMMDSPIHVDPAYLMPRAYEISSRYRSALFDCLYVALGEQENCHFITGELLVIANLSPHFPLVKPLSSLP